MIISFFVLKLVINFWCLEVFCGCMCVKIIFWMEWKVGVYFVYWLCVCVVLWEILGGVFNNLFVDFFRYGGWWGFDENVNVCWFFWWKFLRVYGWVSDGLIWGKILICCWFYGISYFGMFVICVCLRMWNGFK